MLRFARKALLLSPLTLLAWTASASDIRAPFDLENSKVLPPKIRNPRIKLLSMDIQEKYNGAGLAEPLGQKLSKNVLWSDIIASQKTDFEKTQVQGTVESLGFTTAESPGATTGAVNTYADVKIPVLAVGLSDKMTLAVAVPIMDIAVSADTGFVKSSQGQSFIDDICTKDPIKCNEAKDKLNNAVNQKLTTKGYEPISSMNVKGVGDIRVIGKYQLANTEEQGLALRTEIGLPTGIAPNADRALDVPTGDGQWDVGAGMIYDRHLTPELNWNLTGLYLAQLPSKLDRRLPVSATDSISADKENLLRDLGDQVNLGTSMSYFFPKLGLTLGAGYNFQSQFKTTYQDGAFDSNRYRLLENEMPIQELHSATLLAGFSTVEFFKAKKFVLPLQANVAFSQPIAGKNSTTNQVLAAELVLFF